MSAELAWSYINYPKCDPVLIRQIAIAFRYNRGSNRFLFFVAPMSSSVAAQLAPLFTVERTIVLPISTFSAVFFIYGIYVLLFGTYIFMMRSRGQRLNAGITANKLYPILTTILFLLSTIFVVVYIFDMVRYSILAFKTVKTGDYQPFIRYYILEDVGDKAVYAFELLIPILINIAADWMLVHRCYTIWGFNKRIGVPLVLAAVIINAVGLAGIIIILVSFGDSTSRRLYAQGAKVKFANSVASAAFNSILTLLTAGRIWWIHRQVRAHGVHTTDRFVQSTYRIILESGILYPLCQIIAQIKSNTTSTTTNPFDFAPIVTLSGGIAPTLIMVRAKFGKNTESLQMGEVISDIRFDDQPRAATTTTTGTQMQSVNVALTDVVAEPREEERKVSEV